MVTVYNMYVDLLIYSGACEVAKEIKHQDEATEIQSQPTRGLQLVVVRDLYKK